MGLVLDASIVACWILPDEQNAKADLALDALERERAFVPEIWGYEVRNLLIMNERRGRISMDITTAALKFLSVLPIDVGRDTDEDATLDLARRHRLTFYDAAYLELARRKSFPLATLDADLIAAARMEQIPLL